MNGDKIDRMVAAAAELALEHLNSCVTVKISPIGVDEVTCDNEVAERVYKRIRADLNQITEKLTETNY